VTNTANKIHHSDDAHLKAGMFFGGAAALIWGAWPVITALGVDANLSAYQLVLLRVFIAGPLLLPWALRGTHSKKEWGKVIILTLVAGAPYSFVVSSGFQYTTATHAGVIIPGTIMLASLIASHFFLRDKLNRFRAIGSVGIILGLWLLASGTPQGEGMENSLTGDLLFFAGGLMWAAYTLLLRVWPMDPIVVTARVAFMSLLCMILLAPWLPGTDFSDVPTSTLWTQGLWQGMISSVVAIVLFNRGVALMGPARAGVTNAVIPVVSTILAFVVLSEEPTPVEALGLLSILAGIGIAMFMSPKKAVEPAMQES
jgi:drug/metabolite transporter (DMT)-like permease